MRRTLLSWWHALTWHDHEMTFPEGEASLRWLFVCACGHTTDNMNVATHLSTRIPRMWAVLIGLVVMLLLAGCGNAAGSASRRGERYVERWANDSVTRHVGGGVIAVTDTREGVVCYRYYEAVELSCIVSARAILEAGAAP